MKILPVVTVGEKKYFKDDRLLQYRNVVNPSDAVEFGTMPFESICYHEYFNAHVGCPDCHFQDVMGTEVE